MRMRQLYTPSKHRICSVRLASSQPLRLLSVGYGGGVDDSQVIRLLVIKAVEEVPGSGLHLSRELQNNASHLQYAPRLATMPNESSAGSSRKRYVNLKFA